MKKHWLTLDGLQLQWLRWIVFDNADWFKSVVGMSGLITFQMACLKKRYWHGDKDKLNWLLEEFKKDEYIVNKWKRRHD